METIYAMYKGDEYIDQGTIAFLAKKYHQKEKTMYFKSTPVYKKRVKVDGKALLLFKIEECD
ncbi:integrase [Lactobacillaceae bacterium 24-114]